MTRFPWAIVIAVAGLAGCVVGGGGGSSTYGFDSGTTNPPTDTRPPAERACPTNATLTVQLYQVYATPRDPSGDVWDGVSAGTQELLCRVGSSLVRRAVREGLNDWAPGTGKLFERFVGDTFQQRVAQQCGLVAGWLQMRYEGPDMFATGGLNMASGWRTTAEQDTWSAPRTPPWSQAVWRVPCQDASTYMAYDVTDEDVAFDDDVERGTRFRASDITPEAICSCWGWIDGQSGLVGSLFRLQVSGGNQSCDGISSRTFSDFVINDEPDEHGLLNSTQAAGPSTVESPGR
jgi:hypothetical protein